MNCTGTDCRRADPDPMLLPVPSASQIVIRPKVWKELCIGCTWLTKLSGKGQTALRDENR